MALTAYCKKCGREVEPGEICPRCGTRLGKNAAHAAWCVERTPVKDWMYWNSVMRLLLPGALAILVLVLLAELVSGGIGAVERMLASAFLPVLGILLAGVLAAVFLVLLAQGKELSDFVIDAGRTPRRLEGRGPGTAVAGKVHGAVLRPGLVAADSRGLHAVLLGRRDGVYPGEARAENEGPPAAVPGGAGAGVSPPQAGSRVPGTGSHADAHGRNGIRGPARG